MKWWGIYLNLSVNTIVKLCHHQSEDDQDQETFLANLQVNAIVRVPHPWRGDRKNQKTFSAHSVDKQTRNYDSRVLKPLSILIIS